MKRYRVLREEFDTRANILSTTVEDHWEEHIKEMWLENKEQIKRGLLYEYGFDDAAMKLKNFLDLGAKPFSVISYHNRFAQQARRAFIIGAYYPSLTGACALGERILNHLVLDLREQYRETPEYKNVQKKKSFDNWDRVISTLEAWNVLLPPAVEAFKKLKEARNRRAIHFHRETDDRDREFALEAVKALSEIISVQFGTIPPKPWFIPDIEAAGVYIKKDMEEDPFVKLIYLPNSVLVGPEHYLEGMDDGRWKVFDNSNYDDRNISDTEYGELLKQAQDERFAQMREAQEGTDTEQQT
ncbi:MAG: hypothetical protein AVDCRST_MAG14-2606 [uncultured Rubrobacteraceae bacterium]|uniref:HEPN domain-containing protein n=1 Tax=uncultured Rubrobacteraceae bacterium TaxID=349277 RepID=A0A6J4RAB8_9ACTN|nr:MAG: hypothetical protein AVDCRST_MAG14-2606 [uncultured Rubrobacteraceae bacterium]